MNYAGPQVVGTGENEGLNEMPKPELIKKKKRNIETLGVGEGQTAYQKNITSKKYATMENGE